MRDKEIACPFRKLYPTILMLKATEEVSSDDAAAALYRSAKHRVGLLREDGAAAAIVTDEAACVHSPVFLRSHCRENAA